MLELASIVALSASEPDVRAAFVPAILIVEFVTGPPAKAARALSTIVEVHKQSNSLISAPLFDHEVVLSKVKLLKLARRSVRFVNAAQLLTSPVNELSGQRKEVRLVSADQLDTSPVNDVESHRNIVRLVRADPTHIAS